MSPVSVHGKPYFFTAVSRTPFDSGRFPKSLNASGSGRARLDNFDASSGNLWSFRFVGGHGTAMQFSNPTMLSAARKQEAGRASGAAAGGPDRCFTLACMNYLPENGEPQVMYLAPDLHVVPDEIRAQLWQCLPVPATKRLLPGELTMQIRAHGTDKLLCSDDKCLNVYLLKPADAAVLDPATGNHIFNDTWEATPDDDPPAELVEGLMDALK